MHKVVNRSHPGERLIDYSGVRNRLVLLRLISVAAGAWTYPLVKALEFSLTRIQVKP